MPPTRSAATPASNALPPFCRISNAAAEVSGCPAEMPALRPITGGRSAAFVSALTIPMASAKPKSAAKKLLMTFPLKRYRCPDFTGVLWPKPLVAGDKNRLVRLGARQKGETTLRCRSLRFCLHGLAASARSGFREDLFQAIQEDEEHIGRVADQERDRQQGQRSAWAHHAREQPYHTAPDGRDEQARLV